MSKRVDNVHEEKKEEGETKDQSRKPGQVIYPLKTPIKSYGEDVKIIRMRRPTPRDLVTVGNPVIFYPHAEPVRIEHDYDKVVAMVARLSTDPVIPSSSLADLDLNDLVGLAWAISPFFTPAR